MKRKWYLSLLAVCILALAGCGGQATPTAAPTAAPTVDPAIFNQVPDTTTFEPGECSVVLDAPAPFSTAPGTEQAGELAAGTYEVGVAAQYSTSLWYALSDDGSLSWINSTSVSSTTGDCTLQ